MLSFCQSCRRNRRQQHARQLLIRSPREGDAHVPMFAVAMPIFATADSQPAAIETASHLTADSRMTAGVVPCSVTYHMTPYRSPLPPDLVQVMPTPRNELDAEGDTATEDYGELFDGHNMVHSHTISNTLTHDLAPVSEESGIALTPRSSIIGLECYYQPHSRPQSAIIPVSENEGNVTNSCLNCLMDEFDRSHMTELSVDSETHAISRVEISSGTVDNDSLIPMLVNYNLSNSRERDADAAVSGIPILDSCIAVSESTESLLTVSLPDERALHQRNSSRCTDDYTNIACQAWESILSVTTTNISARIPSTVA